MIIRIMGLVLFLTVLLIMTTLPDSAEGRVVVVDEKGGGNYTNIRDPFTYGLDDGDTVLVKPGNYTATSIWFSDNNISLIGTSADTTNISFEGGYIPITFFHNSGIIISNLTLFYHNDDAANQDKEYFQFTFYNNTDITVRNCTIHRADILVAGKTDGILFSNTELIDCRFRTSYSISDDPDHHPYRLVNTTLNGQPIHHLIDVHDLVITNGVAGYIIENCTNITFRNIVLKNWSIGLSVFHSQDIVIENSALDSSYGSLVAYYSSNFTIRSCDFRSSQTGQRYILMGILTNAHITRNIFSTFVQVINIRESAIEDNIFVSSGLLYPLGNSDLAIRNNSFEEGGIYLAPGIDLHQSFDPFSTIIENNHVNGKPIYYYHDATNIRVPEDAGQVILINCTNMTLSDLNLASLYTGVLVWGSSRISIVNSSFHDIYSPIKAILSTDILIENCLIDTSPFHEGITFTYTNRSVIRNTRLENAQINIFGTGNVVLNCTLTSDSTEYWGGISTSGNCTITNCTISGFKYGIRITGDNMLVRNSSITNNENGVEARGQNCTVVNCWVVQNSGFGVAFHEVVDTINTTLDARYNYWGAVNGPYHPEGNPSGWGDAVGDGVLFSPWHESRDFVPFEGSYGDGTDDNGDDPDVMGLVFMLMVLSTLFVVLAIFVIEPGPGRLQ